VRRRLIHYGATLILTLCIWGHVSEIFDRWDNTPQTGNDIEYSTVIVALIVGAVFAIAHVAAIALRAISATSCHLFLLVVCLPVSPNRDVSISHSPPQPLRI
jgi:hypothetical protein